MPRNTAVDWFRLIYPFFCGLWVVSPVTNLVLVGFMPHFQTHPATVSYHRLDHISSYILHMMIFNEEHVFFWFPSMFWENSYFQPQKSRFLFSIRAWSGFLQSHPCGPDEEPRGDGSPWLNGGNGNPDFGSKMSNLWPFCGGKNWWKLRNFGVPQTQTKTSFTDFLSELVDYAVLNPMVRSIGSF